MELCCRQRLADAGCQESRGLAGSLMGRCVGSPPPWSISRTAAPPGAQGAAWVGWSPGLPRWNACSHHTALVAKGRGLGVQGGERCPPPGTPPTSCCGRLFLYSRSGSHQLPWHPHLVLGGLAAFNRHSGDGSVMCMSVLEPFMSWSVPPKSHGFRDMDADSSTATVVTSGRSCDVGSIWTAAAFPSARCLFS